MIRTVTSHLELTAEKGTELVFSVAVARVGGYDSVEEELTLVSDGEPVAYEELPGDRGTVLHVVHADRDLDLTLDYRAVVTGTGDPQDIDLNERVVYRRPSRYVPSDRVLAPAHAAFGGYEGQRLLDEVAAWVQRNIAYVPGASRPTDGAVETLLSRDGVCRDFTHLTLAFLRARDVPARLVSAYAPGLVPMDFHAVVEAFLDGQWRVVDTTGLAPRQSLVRIGTGRDAADTAFLSTYGGYVRFTGIKVGAVVSPTLPVDDGASPFVMH
ncbi:transglutaminase-like domain-containing protein [Solicola sp. PLA-1-18]|uniref:transglutaminase-like domain-containing protein n=1 Tax=Solicola sp. PLA-1-18 TaxID=3380532 RepID=UPI003B829276